MFDSYKEKSVDLWMLYGIIELGFDGSDNGLLLRSTMWRNKPMLVYHLRYPSLGDSWESSERSIRKMWLIENHEIEKVIWNYYHISQGKFESKCSHLYSMKCIWKDCLQPVLLCMAQFINGHWVKITATMKRCVNKSYACWSTFWKSNFK